jgi:TP901 family phage tail tape measure protein
MSVVQKSAGQATNQVSRFSKVMQGVNVVAHAGVNAFLGFSNALRLTAQGMMSVGKTMSFFITPVIVLALRDATRVAVEFDNQMVRVSKTTGLASVELRKLEMGLRNLGMTTATTQVELAQIAEGIGQATDIRNADAIVKLVDIFNMLTTATDISADKVAMSMGKIAAAFGIDLNTEEGVQEIEKLSSVINRLENNLTATAPDILKGLENLAQVGSILEMDPHIGAALVAALQSIGFSAEEAGTALRNMSLKMIQNADEVAAVMAATEKYDTELEVLNAIQEDSAQVMTDFIAAMAQGDEAALSAAAAIDILGIRGGKGATALAGGYETLQKSLALANDEYEEAISLWTEYQQALLSTQNQTKILRNNINELSLTFKDALLPIINEVIQMAIPAIRWLAKEFKNLSPEVKRNIILFAVGLAVLGPLILFLSQIAFGFGMVMIAVGKTAQSFLALVGTLGKLGLSWQMVQKGLVSFAGMLGGLPGIIAVAIGAILLRFTGLGKKLADFFINLGEKAKAWGENLIATYGQGILSGAVNVLSRVLTAVGNFIGRFLAGRSPPELGPLSHIDLWGQNVFDAFLGGFLNADFSILSQVGGMIEKVLSTLAKVGKIGEKQQFTFAMQARQDLAELIKIFNETGEIADDVLNRVVQNLGNASDEMKELITLWLEYNKIQKELAELQAQRDQVLDTYRQEIQLIAQSNMSAEEKAEAIRQAMRERDEELKQIAEEEAALEDQADEKEAQLEYQRAMMEAMQHQDDLQLRLLDTLDKLSGKLGSLDDFEFPELSFEPGGLDDAFDDIAGGILTMEERIKRASGVWDAFLAGFRGEEAPDIDAFLQDVMGEEEYNLAKKIGLEEVDPELAKMVERMDSAYATGQKIKGVWDGISGVFETIGGFFDKIFKGGEEGGDRKSILETLGFDPDTIENIKEIWSGSMEEIKKTLGPVWEDIFKRWKKIWDKIKESGIAKILGKIIDKISNLFKNTDWHQVWQDIGEIVTTVISAIIFVISGLVTGIIWLVTTTVDILSQIPEIWQKIKERVRDILIGLALFLMTKWIELHLFLVDLWEQIKEKASEIWENIVSAVVTWVTELVARVGVAWENMKTAISEKAESILASIITWLATIITNAIAKWQELKTAAQTKWEEIKTAIVTKLTEIATKIADKVIEWKNKITEKIDAFKTAGSDLIQGVIDGIDSKVQGVINAVKNIYNKALEWWNKIWALGSPSKVMMESGRFIMEGVVVGMQSMEGEIVNTMTGVAELGMGTMPMSSPMAPIGGALPATAPSNNKMNVEINFGRDSVRNEDDIRRITEEVERILQQRAQGSMSMGDSFGSGF